MMEIAAVGSEDFVLGFRLAGIRNIHPATPENLDEVVRAVMVNEKIGIVVVHAEEIKQLPQGLRQRMLDSINPVFITIGGEEDELREKVKRAIGVDLYKS